MLIYIVCTVVMYYISKAFINCCRNDLTEDARDKMARTALWYIMVINLVICAPFLINTIKMLVNFFKSFESFEEFTNFIIGCIVIIVFLIAAAFMPSVKDMPDCYKRAIKALNKKN